MKRRVFFTDIGNLLGALIEAIVFYLINIPPSKMVISNLLKGGVAILTLGPVTMLVYYQIFGEPIDHTAIPIGLGLITLALIIFAIDRAFAKREKPEIFVEPIASYFQTDKRVGEDGDPKFKEDRGFDITTNVRVKAGRSDLKLLKAELFGFDRGLHLFQTTQEYKLGSRRIIGVCEDPDMWREPVCDAHRVDGDYVLQPAITIAANDFIDFSVSRHFHGPYAGRGAPIDFNKAELKLHLQYVVDGATKSDKFYFVSNYNTNGLATIPTLSTVSYFSDRQVAYWYQKKDITAGERDALLEIDPEIRVRILEGDEDDSMKLFQKWNVEL